MAVNQFDVIESTCRAEFDGVDDVVNVFQHQMINPATITEADAISDLLTLFDILYTIILGAQSALLLYRDIRMFNKTQNTILGVFPWPGISAGGSTGQALPPGVCLLSSFSTQIARVSPRKYWGGFVETVNEDDGTFNAATVAAAVLMNASLLIPQSYPNGVWQYGYFSPKTVSFVKPTGATVTNIPAYQRRRKQGRGS